MGILRDIFSKIFPSSHPAVAQAPVAPPPGASQQSGATATAPQQQQQGTAAGRVAAEPVDVEAILSDMAERAGRPLNWRTSIVDLMTLLGLDSSLAARKELARELHYAGDLNDSAAMNVWLHRQVMVQLAENGGKVPPQLRT